MIGSKSTLDTFVVAGTVPAGRMFDGGRDEYAGGGTSVEG